MKIDYYAPFYYSKDNYFVNLLDGRMYFDKVVLFKYINIFLKNHFKMTPKQFYNYSMRKLCAQDPCTDVQLTLIEQKYIPCEK